MRPWCVMFLCLVLCGMLPARAAEPAGPLTLTVKADRTVLLARMPTNVVPATALLTGLTPLNLRLTLTNTGTAPLTLNTYDLACSRLRVEVTGPQENSVTRMAVMVDRKLVRETPEDYPVLQPGQSWTLPQPLRFPGVIGTTSFALKHFGAYRLRVTYANLPYYRRETPTGWLGAVSSEPLTVQVVEASEPMNGLQLGLQLTEERQSAPNRFTFTAHLRNGTDQPITVPTWDLQPDALQLLDGANTPLPAQLAPVNASRLAGPGELRTTIQPGEQQAIPLRGQYVVTDFGELPAGTFWTTSRTGHGMLWTARGRAVFVRAVINVPAGQPEGTWSGQLASPRQSLSWDPSRYYQTRLNGKLERFTLRLAYDGPQEKPFYGLSLATTPVSSDDPFNRAAQITEPQAALLIDAMAKAGLLRLAQSPEQSASPQAPTGYTLTITGSDALRIPLGWNLTTCRQLAALQAVLPDTAQPAMTLLLGRISGLQAEWELAEALEQPLTLTIPAGTVDSAAATLRTAVGHQLQVRVDKARAPLPLPELTCCHVPAHEAFQLLAGPILDLRARRAGLVMSLEGYDGEKN